MIYNKTLSFFEGGMTTWIMLAVIIIIIVMTIVSAITKRKKDKIEREKRQKEVRTQIKQYLKDTEKVAHKRVDYDKVVARSGKEYKYRDVFDVVVNLYDARKNELYATKAFEVEGFTKQLSKKQYETIWKVNQELDLQETIKRIEASQKKSKLTKAEKTELKKKLKIEAIEAREADRLAKIEYKKIKKNAKNQELDLIRKTTTEKFIGKK